MVAACLASYSSKPFEKLERKPRFHARDEENLRERDHS